MTLPTTGSRSGREGYALLALLASSAILLAGLALSLPRMAMQSQRGKEERLIERGEQYRRAIQLYYREHNKYPRELEDLEDTDGVRFLRRRYEEPMGETGEWRIIHMGTDGRFEDSLLYDLARPGTGQGMGPFGASGPELSAGPEGSGLPTQAGTSGFAGFADPRAAPGPQPLVGAARARAARESAAPDLATRNRYSQGFEFNANQAAGSLQEADGQPGAPPDYSRMLPSNVPMDENDPRRTNPYGIAGQPGRNAVPSGPRGGPSGANQGIAGGAGVSGPVAAGSAPQPPGNPAGLASGSGAAQMINRLLTSPRPGGLAGQASTQTPVATAPVFERGIAGVASETEEFGVKVYGGKEHYHEWEFVYDYRKDADARGNAGGAPNQVRGQQQPTQNRNTSQGRTRR